MDVNTAMALQSAHIPKSGSIFYIKLIEVVNKYSKNLY